MKIPAVADGRLEARSERLRVPLPSAISASSRRFVICLQLGEKGKDAVNPNKKPRDQEAAKRNG